MDNPEEQWKTKQKHNTMFIGHHYAQTNTNYVNKTWALLQTTEGKDDRILFLNFPFFLFSLLPIYLSFFFGVIFRLFFFFFLLCFCFLIVFFCFCCCSCLFVFDLFFCHLILLYSMYTAIYNTVLLWLFEILANHFPLGFMTRKCLLYKT